MSPPFSLLLVVLRGQGAANSEQGAGSGEARWLPSPSGRGAGGEGREHCVATFFLSLCFSVFRGEKRGFL